MTSRNYDQTDKPLFFLSTMAAARVFTFYCIVITRPCVGVLLFGLFWPAGPCGVSYVNLIFSARRIRPFPWFEPMACSMAISMLDFMRKHERRFQANSKPKESPLFDEHFTKDDFKAVTLAWKRNGSENTNGSDISDDT